MVFWASCRPCPSAMPPAEKVCAIRKPRWTRPGRTRRKPHRMASITPYARRKPTTGESTIGMTTFSTTPDHLTLPADERVAPTSPPMSACDEDEGNPSHHVVRFHAMAPTRPASTMTRLCCATGRSTIPRPTVSATPVPRKAPSRFMTAAMTSAARGVSARVETDVAMALAASWKPLV